MARVIVTHIFEIFSSPAAMALGILAVGAAGSFFHHHLRGGTRTQFLARWLTYSCVASYCLIVPAMLWPSFATGVGSLASISMAASVSSIAAILLIAWFRKKRIRTHWEILILLASSLIATGTSSALVRAAVANEWPVFRGVAPLVPFATVKYGDRLINVQIRPSTFAYGYAGIPKLPQVTIGKNLYVETVLTQMKARAGKWPGIARRYLIPKLVTYDGTVSPFAGLPWDLQRQPYYSTHAWAISWQSAGRKELTLTLYAADRPLVDSEEIRNGRAYPVAQAALPVVVNTPFFNPNLLLAVISTVALLAQVLIQAYPSIRRRRPRFEVDQSHVESIMRN